jgi:hypothetical protein
VRATLRTLTILGGVTAALLLAATPAPAQMSGGVGTSSGGGGGRGGGGTAGGTGGTAVTNNMPTSITAGATSGDTLLGSFSNVANVRSTVDASNPLAGTYVNPLSQGMPSNPSPSFGSALYANSSGGSVNNTLGGGSSGTRGSSFGTFGGATGSRGGTTGGFSSAVGGRTAGSFGGSATIRGSGTSGTTSGGLSFPGGSLGPAIGRYGPLTAATVRFTSQPVSPAVRRTDLQGLLIRSPRLSAPAGITVAMDGNTVVLTGRVANDDERRLAENMLRLSPGVRDVRNELQVPAGGQ